MTDAISRLEAVALRLEAYAAKLGGGSGSSSESKGHPALGAYDDWTAGPVAAFEKAANDLKLSTIAGLVKTGVAEVRHIIDAAFHCKKPTDKKAFAAIGKVVTDADRHVGRKDEPNFAHQKSFAEAISALNWVDAPGPAGVVEGQLEAADYYLNQVLTAAKKATTEEEKGHHRTYVKALKELLTSLAEFLRSNFKMGVIWNAKGADFSSWKPGQSDSSSSSSGGPPAPPLAPSAPPLAPSLPESTSSAPSSAPAGGMSAVFASIQAGQDSSATQAFGLKHVSKEMKSKNISAPPKEKKEHELKAAKALIASEAKKKGEPRVAMDKGTWAVEFHEDRHDLVIPDVQMKHAVYVMKCSNCTIRVPDKCKTISMDGCHRVNFILKSVVSTFEIVNSTRCTVQIEEYCASVAIDKTHGFSVILTPESYKNPPDIITSNVSELNLVIPGPTESDDPIEIPIPEQYVSKLDKKTNKLSTSNVSHGG